MNKITKQESDPDHSKLFYKGHDITSLFIRIPESLTIEEKKLLKEFYVTNGREFVENAFTEDKIVPFAACVLVSINCDKVYWKEKHDSFVEKNNKIKDLLDNIFTKLDSFGCKTLALTENFGVVLRSNSCLGCFCSGDVDIYADINEKEKIESCLNSMNFFCDYRSGRVTGYSKQISMFYNPDIFGDGYWINILWTTTSRAFLVQDKYDARLAKERLRADSILGTTIRVLKDTPLMYFCALHIACGHYYTLTPGLRLYVDIDRLARNSNIDWDLIIKWTKDDSAGIRIATVMYLSHKLLKTPIPEKVYEKVFRNRRNKKFINYLYDEKINKIQSNSNKFRRLYIELSSDGKKIMRAIYSRLLF
jgi:hypothetical protein